MSHTTQIDLGDSRKVRLTFWTNETTLGLALPAGAATFRVRDVTGYSASGVVILDPTSKDRESLTISSVSGLVITPTSVPLYAHGLDTVVGLLTDPTTVTLRIKEPDGTVTSYTYAAADLTKVSTGIYTYTFAPDQVGSGWLEAIGTGTVVAVDELAYTVRASQVP